MSQPNPLPSKSDLADPTTVIVTDGSVEAEADVLRERLRAHRDRCGACGQFLRADSYYTNRCSDCWGPEDEFL